MANSRKRRRLIRQRRHRREQRRKLGVWLIRPHRGLTEILRDLFDYADRLHSVFGQPREVVRGKSFIFPIETGTRDAAMQKLEGGDESFTTVIREAYIPVKLMSDDDTIYLGHPTQED